MYDTSLDCAKYKINSDEWFKISLQEYIPQYKRQCPLLCNIQDKLHFFKGREFTMNSMFC